ncbi:MAG: glutamate racemase [Bacteroidales bacterium]|nr:glutamate racemase [Bacteroidales bacterium]
MNNTKGPIGVFDSGFGGLTILKGIRDKLPQYDYFFIGDSARAPYGERSADIVYEFVCEALRYFFDVAKCPIVMLGCNTASSEALPKVQSEFLPKYYPDKVVLGVIKPTVEYLAKFPADSHIGVMATPGTIASGEYQKLIKETYPGMTVSGQGGAMFVPLIEHNEIDTPPMLYFAKKYSDELMAQDPQIKTIILGCTHYPLIKKQLAEVLPKDVELISQEDFIGDYMKKYLDQHPNIKDEITTGGTCIVTTTENPDKFDPLASEILNFNVQAKRIRLGGNNPCQC